MIDEQTKADILRNISLGGSADAARAFVKPIIADDKNLSLLLDKSSGRARIYSHRLKHFALVLSQPVILSALNPFEIRCCFCRAVIRYPAWYYSIKYAVNHFHYFVCFDSASPEKPSTKCYRKDI